MNDLKQESKLSFKNKGFVVACLAILLFGVVIFRIKFPALRGELSDTLFIAMLLAMFISAFQKKK